jgi:hypothetical protein
MENRHTRYRVMPQAKTIKNYPHVSIVFNNQKDLDDFDKAIAEEKASTGMTKINRSSIIKKLVKKWVNYEITI